MSEEEVTREITGIKMIGVAIIDIDIKVAVPGMVMMGKTIKNDTTSIPKASKKKIVPLVG